MGKLPPVHKKVLMNPKEVEAVLKNGNWHMRHDLMKERETVLAHKSEWTIMENENSQILVLEPGNFLAALHRDEESLRNQWKRVLLNKGKDSPYDK